MTLLHLLAQAAVAPDPGAVAAPAAAATAASSAEIGRAHV